ncbi:hypothetical protein K491DRAFT_220884 [Lophiostoma macrostomum CBS 122681]|uniref:Uncharacterized protein n=1 Tax=Lophiostoma macrostomum CBS 122681 TaxID=1314788 RepID=A0A6A6SPT9_9PLEO|nr:hypothetical protein K491DRAFT_220884 [Lophiostoma macrostomum CBS 122681]
MQKSSLLSPGHIQLPHSSPQHSNRTRGSVANSLIAKLMGRACHDRPSPPSTNARAATSTCTYLPARLLPSLTTSFLETTTLIYSVTSWMVEACKMAPPRPRIKEEPVDDASPYLNPPAGPHLDPNAVIGMDDLDHMIDEIKKEDESEDSDSDSGSDSSSDSESEAESESGSSSTSDSGEDEAEDENLSKVRNKIGPNSESEDDATDDAADDDHGTRSGYINAPGNKRIKVESENSKDQPTPNNVLTSNPSKKRREIGGTNRRAAKATGKAENSQGGTEKKDNSRMARNALRATAREQKLQDEVAARRLSKDLDFGPLTETNDKSSNSYWTRMLEMKTQRIKRERVQHYFNRKRGPYDVPPHVAARQIYQNLCAAASQKSQYSESIIAGLVASTKEGTHVPVGSLGNSNFSLWSRNYLPVVQKPVFVEMRIRTLPGYGMEIPGTCSYSADLVFSPPFAVVDRIIGLVHMTLPAPDACVPKSPVKLLAYIADPVAKATLDWMKRPLSRHNARRGPLQYFAIEVTFLGHRQMMLRIPSHACWQAASFSYQASDQWPTHFDFFAEPIMWSRSLYRQLFGGSV